MGQDTSIAIGESKEAKRRFAQDVFTREIYWPHNHEAEIQLLGAILSNNRAYEAVVGLIEPDDFSDDRHGMIFATIQRLIEASRQASVTTLKSYFERDGSLDDLGGTPYLAELAGAAVTLINVKDHAALIRDCAMRRKAIEAHLEAIQSSQDMGQPAESVIDGTVGKLEGIRLSGMPGSEPVSLGAATETAIRLADEAMKRGTRIIGVPTDLHELDYATGGLVKDNLIILAGRPSMGKSALAIRIAYNASRKEHVVAYFTPEMSNEEIAQRAAGPYVGVSPFDLRIGNIKDPSTWTRLLDAQREFARLPFIIDDSSAPTVPSMRAKCRAILRKRKRLDLIVVDHIGWVKPSKEVQKKNNRVAELAEIGQGLKALAKEFHCPVLALHQLNRSVEQREDKRPMLSDLRDSGTLEQDADVVMFVYRDSYYLERSEPKQLGGEDDKKFNDRYEIWEKRSAESKDIGEVIIAKQRNGPVGTKRLHFDEQMAQWSNLAL